VTPPALAVLHTARLRLLALTAHHLRLYLADADLLERELGFPVSRALVDDVVRRAMVLKLGTMAVLPPAHQVWATYWLLVPHELPEGIGMAGFKGTPDDDGEVEIGYGVDPAMRRRGYASEAATALVSWALEQPGCRAVIACRVRRDNLASQRVLAHAGLSLWRETEETVDFRITRPGPTAG
jgi:RimJ/RimL family protein N-acetyltransferase